METHHHHYWCPRSELSEQTGAAIVAALQRLEDQMSKTTAALGDLSATDDTLAAKLTDLLTAFAGEPTAIAAAVAAALVTSGVDDDTASAAVEAARARSQSFVDKITAALSPVAADPIPAPVEPAADTVAAPVAADTVVGAASDDAVAPAPVEAAPASDTGEVQPGPQD